MYTAADKEYLHSLGHSVIDAPAAARMITPSTLVFGIHLPTQAYLDCLAGASPAMVVGTGYTSYEMYVLPSPCWACKFPHAGASC